MTKTVIHTHIRHKITMPVLIIASLLFAVVLLFSRSGELRDFLIPGNKEVTEAALSAMVDDIREGEALGDAFAAFCMEIIDNANIPQ